MADPIVEQIAADVLTTVQTVTTGNGYNYTVSAKRMPSQAETIGPADLGVILYQGDPAKKTDSEPQNRYDWMQPFFLACYVSIKEDDVTEPAIETKVNRVRADIEKALMVDRNRSTLAIDTIIGEPVAFDTGIDGMDGIVVRIDVWYRVDQDDPYTQG